MRPLISVIFTSGDDNRGLNEYRDSLTNQTLSNFEIIEVKGEACRNAGLGKAQGEYVLFVDGAEVYPEDMLESLYNAAQQNGADIAVANCELIYSDDKKYFRRGVHSEWVRGEKTVFNRKDCSSRVMNVVLPIVGSKLYRRQFIIDAGLNSDDEIAYSALGAARAEKIVYVKNLTFSRLVNPENESVKDLHDNTVMVESMINHVRKITYCSEIWNALMYFSIRQYVDNYEAYCRELCSDDMIDYYNHAHALFNSEDFAGVTVKELNDDKLFRKYSIIKKHDCDKLKKLKTRRIIVSLTSYPARIAGIGQVLESIYVQTRKADKVVLWLAEAQFPRKEEELPEDLIKLQEEDKLEIRWCDDLKPHKKYFYALQEFTDDVVVTIDDDLIYPTYLLEELYLSYLQYPKAVSAGRTHFMAIAETEHILPYKYWMKEVNAYLSGPCMQLFVTGGGGALYPPGLLGKEWFDKDAINQTCLWADDLWLKVMEVMSDVPVVAAMPFEDLNYLPGSQDVALYHKNVDADQNDIQLEKINKWLDAQYGENVLARKILEYDGVSSSDCITRLCEFHEIDRKRSRKCIVRLNKTVQRAKAEKKAMNNKLQQTYQQKAEINEKLQRTYQEKSELNKKLQKAYEEKSEINKKLQVTYQEKAERGKTIKALNNDLTACKKELEEYKAMYEGTFTYKLKKIVKKILKRE